MVEALMQRDIKAEIAAATATFGPTADRLLILPDPIVKMIGSFELPEGAREKPIEGTVVAVGEGVRDHTGKLIKMGFKPGDRCIYSGYAGQPVGRTMKIGEDRHEREYLMMREDEVLIRLLS